MMVSFQEEMRSRITQERADATMSPTDKTPSRTRSAPRSGFVQLAAAAVAARLRPGAEAPRPNTSVAASRPLQVAHRCSSGRRGNGRAAATSARGPWPRS